MEAFSALSPERLLRGLDFRSGESASYVLERNLGVQFPAQTGSPYSPSDTKLIRVHVADQDPCIWADLSTLRLNFILKNTGTANLKMIGPPGVMWQRLKLYVRGTLTEDRQYIARESMQHMYLREKVRNEDDLKEAQWTTPIAPGEERWFSHDPYLGLLHVPQMHLISLAPLTFEFEVVYSADQPFEGDDNKWQILQPYITCDTLRLDPGFCQQYHQSVMAGQPLNLEYSSQTTQMFVVPNAGATAASDFSIAISRAFMRIQGILITFYRDVSGTNPALKEANHFQFPSDPQTFECQILFGNKVIPQHPIRGAYQAFVNTRKALSQMSGGSVDITYDQWVSSRFILLVNFERARMGNSQQASHSGIGSQGGESIIVNFKALNATNPPTHVYVTLYHECALSIRADGVEYKV